MTSVSIHRWAKLCKTDIIPELTILPYYRIQCHDVTLDSNSSKISFIFSNSSELSAEQIADTVLTQLTKANIKATKDNAGKTGRGMPLYRITVESTQPLDLANALALDRGTTDAIEHFERERVLGTSTFFARALRPATRSPLNSRY